MTSHDPSLENELLEIAFGDPMAARREIFDKLGREYGDGQLIFREGDESSELFIVISGNVDVTMTGTDGNDFMLARLGPGAMVGEMSHFDDAPRSATARAHGTTRVLAFSRNDFSLIFQLHPKWTLQLIYGLTAKIRHALDRCEEKRQLT